MRAFRRQCFVVMALCGLCCGSAGLWAAGERSSELATRVLATDGSVEGVIEELRERGPAGLKVLLELRATLANGIFERVGLRESVSEELRRLDAVIDRVSGQRYGSVSQLYWYADLAKARAAAQEQNKPILSLHMLGNLTDEFSCANSRFFRTTLYANAEVGRRLREGFVLHWESVRPVPVATIDFGDGRILRRTLTGNSIHYALLPDGRLIDGLPGLNDVPTFQEWLDAVATFSQNLSDVQRLQPRPVSKGVAATKNISSNEELVRFLGMTGKVTPLSLADPTSIYTALLQKFHRDRQARLIERWITDLRKVTKAGNDPIAVANELRAMETSMAPSAQTLAPPSAKVAGRLPVTKAVVEINIVSAMETSRKQYAELESATSEQIWNAFGVLYRDRAVLDPTSRALIAKENPMGAQNISDSQQALLTQLFQNLQQSIAIDTVRNEYLMHRKIHEWVVGSSQPLSVHELNTRVYNELFLTPKSDPWLGLVSPLSYSGLQNNGLSAR